jgi:hypothetical protein
MPSKFRFLVLPPGVVVPLAVVALVLAVVGCGDSDLDPPGCGERGFVITEGPVPPVLVAERAEPSLRSRDAHDGVVSFFFSLSPSSSGTGEVVVVMGCIMGGEDRPRLAGPPSIACTMEMVSPSVGRDVTSLSRAVTSATTVSGAAMR